MLDLSRDFLYALHKCEPERLKLAMDIKNCGNRYYKQNQHEEALWCYRKAINYVLLFRHSCPQPQLVAKFDLCGNEKLKKLPSEENRLDLTLVFSLTTMSPNV